MADYQVIARKFRPQSFQEVIGQKPVVTTLKNAMESNRLAQAYIFCGSRGTGKTTLARILAKALNCPNRTKDQEPCNQCSSCQEITGGNSLNVLEIDGASHRGIEDIRQINDTVGYSTASGGYKIYIIDEVHMLTKEAFNALLKTLEEPPPKVKFFFATTEVHKIPSTILSRCQRFQLNRIPAQSIIQKLKHVAKELKVEVEEDALLLIAKRAEGGLRDAESLFDQILAFQDGPLTLQSAHSILGLMPLDVYFEMDRAGKAGDFAKAFDITSRLFNEGKNIPDFIDGLIEHIRHILLIKVSGPQANGISLSSLEKEQYVETAKLYSQEQCLDLMEYLLDAQAKVKTTAFGKIALETILLHVMRSHFRLSVETLVRHLSELEQRIQEKETSPLPPVSEPIKSSTATPVPLSPPMTQAAVSKIPPSPPNKITQPVTPIPSSKAPIPVRTESPPTKTVPSSLFESLTEDPTPSAKDLGKRPLASPSAIPSPVSTPSIPSSAAPSSSSKDPLHLYDTVMHFAAVELEGRLQK